MQHKPNHTQARKVLAAAIAAHDEAQEALHSATELHARGQKLLASLYAKLAAFDNLDQEIQEVRANIVREAMQRGEVPDLTITPEGYASKLVARENLQLEIKAMIDSNHCLETDLTNAKHAVANAENEVAWTAEQVLADEAEQLAEWFVSALDHLREVQYLLSAIRSRSVPKGAGDVRLNLPMNAGAIALSGAMRSIKLPPVVGQALTDSIIGSYEYRHGTRLRESMGAKAVAFWNDLLKNPDAELHLNVETETSEREVA